MSNILRACRLLACLALVVGPHVSYAQPSPPPHQGPYCFEVRQDAQMSLTLNVDLPARKVSGTAQVLGAGNVATKLTVTGVISVGQTWGTPVQPPTAAWILTLTGVADGSAAQLLSYNTRMTNDWKQGLGFLQVRTSPGAPQHGGPFVTMNQVACK